MSEEPKEKQENEQPKEDVEALETEKKRSEEYLTQLRYLQADFENLKKRMERQIEEAKKYSNERLITELLEIVDELEMAIKSDRASNSTDIMLQGVEMTLKKLKKILTNEGVSPIECVGKPFDPAKHNSVATIEKDNVEECTVVEEVRRGYIMKGKVIRPSTVKISVKPSKSRKEVVTNEQNPN